MKLSAALAEKVIEDNEVTSELILENITSAVLMDLNNINKRGADVIVDSIRNRTKDSSPHDYC